MDCQEIMDFTNAHNAFMRHSGITITQVTPQQVSARAEVRPELLNPAGHLHGGVYFTLADAAAGTLCRTDGRRYVTADSDIRFLRGTGGGVVLARAEFLHRGRRSCTIRVDLTDQEGRLLAAFTGSFACVGEDYRERAPV